VNLTAYDLLRPAEDGLARLDKLLRRPTRVLTGRAASDGFPATAVIDII
jgi:hypothetical protein